MPKSKSNHGSFVEHSIVSARQGSFAALGRLFDHYRGYLLRIACVSVPGDVRAKVSPSDLVQETFLQATKNFREFAGSSEPELRAWLRQILLYTLCDAQRHFSRGIRDIRLEIPLHVIGGDPGENGEPACPRPDPSQALAVTEKYQEMNRRLADLPPDYQRVIEQRIFHRRSFVEIGADMGRTAEAVRKLWARAIRHLATELLDDSAVSSVEAKC